MKAAVLNTSPGDLDIEDLTITEPGPREVLIRTAHAGLCHSDLHFMEGSWPTELPAVMGHEGAGVVEAVGAEVTDVEPGDHVITCPSVFCGKCHLCLSGHPALCEGKATLRRTEAPLRNRAGVATQAFAGLGAFAERMLVHEHALVGIKKDMPLDRAALIGCGVLTGTGAVFRSAKVEPGSTVAVIGAGGIGLAAIQGARIAGAGRVIAVDLVDEKLELAKQLGASDVVNAADADPVEAVRDLTGGGVDYSFEAIGLKKTAEQSWGMLGTRGVSTIIGMLPLGETIDIPGDEIFLGEKRIQGSMMGSGQFRTDMPRLIDFYLDGRLKLDEMVSGHIPLTDINHGYDLMRRGEVARTVIDFEGAA